LAFQGRRSALQSAEKFQVGVKGTQNHDQDIIRYKKLLVVVLHMLYIQRWGRNLLPEDSMKRDLYNMCAEIYAL